jgi:hypothetical protein
VWIKDGLKSDEELALQLPINNTSDYLMEISFGYLTSNTIYCWNKTIRGSNSLRWETEVHKKYVAIECTDNELLELRLTQDCLDKYFIILNNNGGIFGIILPLKVPPRCNRKWQYRRRTCYKRILDFGFVDGACLTNSSALYLRFPSQKSLNNSAHFFICVMKLDCHKGRINCIQMPIQAPLFNHILSDFWSSYAFQMVLALGYRITNTITPVTLDKINHLSNISTREQYPNHQCYLKLMAIYYQARHNRFFDINEEYDCIQPMLSSIYLEKWVYVPRVYLTPYGVVPLPIKPMRGNRVLRERERFGPAENFCRVIIRDVDLGQPQNDFMRIIERWIKDLIVATDRITVGNKQFDFLLCSNSQLRDRSFWFHSPYQGCIVEDIRRWMGDFSCEKCIGTRIARMALSLTGTTATIKVNNKTVFPNL